MDYLYQILMQLIARAAVLLLSLFIITRIKGLKQIFQKQNYERKDLVILSFIFAMFAIFETCTGINVDGSIVNIRIITIMSGGILFGPYVGIFTGIISGLHRYLIDINGVTSIPCLITSILAGFISGIVNKKVSKNYRWIFGIFCGMVCEILTMILILFLTKPYSLGLDIVSKISIPMIIGQVSIGFIVLIVESAENEKEEIAAKQAKLALNIANKTLPYFRNTNRDSLKNICDIIKNEINADAVAMTDTKIILAYVGVDNERRNVGTEIISEETKECVTTGKIIIKNLGLCDKYTLLRSAIIIPLKEKEDIIGTLKIYYIASNKISHSLENLAIGLSSIISTLLELSRVEKIKEMASKAEIKALQTQINPHFLFNALNAIISFIRINPDRARELIINLSSYLRYNLELNGDFIDINSELKQVKDYIEIEKARFGDKLHIIYDIDKVNVKIPSLIIQPLVENAIVHGLLKESGKGVVKISVKNLNNQVKISIEDSGIGISEEVINNIYNDNVKENKIGLYNVHSRIKLIYGKGLIITRLNKGTKVEFYIKR